MTRRYRDGEFSWREWYVAIAASQSDSNLQHAAALPTCPNCCTELKVDQWPRLPRILPTDGKQRRHWICNSCWHRSTVVVDHP